ncbi:MAG: cobalamin-independent methionine synthase II family protein [Desulfobulbaceae bacterium]|nr:cobalamin-independent methionine synthase II family protein [Desulfobulbaceae bacterium]
MRIRTTTVGAWPKPAEVPIPDWFQQERTTDANPTEALDASQEHFDDDVSELLDRITQEVVKEQVNAGIDIPTDGEIRRENYIHSHCRHIEGINFDRLTKKSMRSGAWEVSVPTITQPIRAGKSFLVREWQVAQAVTSNPVKITLPGPMTIMDSVANEFYGSEGKLAHTLADTLNVEIIRLAEAGCRWIQVDDPVFARYPEAALSFGIENLERCFHGVSREVTRCTHICCGYPDKVDSTDYVKAPPSAYSLLAPALDEAAIDAVSIEDAHRPNDLSLLELFENTIVILGVLGIARTRIESIEEIEFRLREAMEHIDKDRIIAAPDCGLGMLTQETVLAKLGHLRQAVERIG